MAPFLVTKASPAEQAASTGSAWKAAVSLILVVVVPYLSLTSSRSDRPIPPAISESVADSASAMYNLGATLQASGRYDRAITNFRRALALNPKLVEARYALGDTLHLAMRYEEAIAVYQDALQEDVFILRTIIRIFATMAAWRREQIRDS